MHRFTRIAVAFCLIISFILSAPYAFASAENPVTTSARNSSVGTAGEWHQESTSTLVSSQTVVYGGDAGIWRYASSVGLAGSFHRTTSRYATYECWEQDVFSALHFRTYRSQFAVVNGLYRPYYTSDTYTSTDIIEGSSSLELFMKYFVDTNDLDTSKYIPSGLFVYKFWAY